MTQEDYLGEALGGSSSGAAIFAEDARIAAMANLVVSLLGGEAGAPSDASLSMDFFSSLATAIVQGGGAPIDLSGASEDESLLQATATAAGLSLSSDTAAGAGKIFASVSQAIDALTVAGTSAYVGQVVQIQTFAEKTIGPRLAKVGAGNANIDTLAAEYTPAAISSQAGIQPSGTLAAPAITISDVTVTTGAGQPSTMTFTVSLTAVPASSQTVSVDYATADGSATAADGDYTPVSSTLTWAPGDTSPQTITVPIGAVAPSADARSFEVVLSDASNAVIENGVGEGTFVSEFATKTTLTTSALSADGNVPVTFTAVVTNQDGTNSPGVGHVDFFDGQTDLGSVTLDGTGTATFTTSFIVPDIHQITAVYAGYQTDGATYDQSTSTTLDESISPATQTITFVPIGDQTYGVDPFDLDPTASSLLPVSLTVLSGPATIDADGLLTITGAGTVVVQASQAGDTDYDAATPVDQTFQVAPASLTITADDQTSAYGAAYPTLTASYDGFVDGDTPASLTTLPTLTTVAAGSPVGSYAIDASGAVDPNYTITYAPGTLTITPAALSVTADAKTSVYGAAYPTLTATIAGAVGSDLATLESELSLSTAPAGSKVGYYAITASGITDPNYDVAYHSGTLTITPAALTITADSPTILYGVAPALTASYKGLVNGDTPASLTLPPTLSPAKPVTRRRHLHDQCLRRHRSQLHDHLRLRHAHGQRGNIDHHRRRRHDRLRRSLARPDGLVHRLGQRRHPRQPDRPAGPGAGDARRRCGQLQDQHRRGGRSQLPDPLRPGHADDHPGCDDPDHHPLGDRPGRGPGRDLHGLGHRPGRPARDRGQRPVPGRRQGLRRPGGPRRPRRRDHRPGCHVERVVHHHRHLQRLARLPGQQQQPERGLESLRAPGPPCPRRRRIATYGDTVVFTATVDGVGHRRGRRAAASSSRSTASPRAPR